MDYYVYIYLDKNKPGRFYYLGLDVCFLFEPFYVGKGTRYRDTRHLLFCHQSKPGTNPFYDKLRNTTSIIERIVTQISDNDAKSHETYFINKIGRRLKNEGPLMNMTDGGTGGDTFSLLSDDKKKEALQKRSNSMLGKNKGKVCSEEQKEKIRISLTGRKNPEHSKRMQGTTQSEETKNKKKKKVIQLSMNDEFIKQWDSATDAANFLNCNQGNITRVCKNIKKSCNGYKWKYF